MSVATLTIYKPVCYAGHMATPHQDQASREKTAQETRSLIRPRSTPKLLQSLAPGVSLKKLHRLSGIPLEHLSRIFNRKRGLTVDKAVKIAQTLNVPVERVISVLVPTNR